MVSRILLLLYLQERFPEETEEIISQNNLEEEVERLSVIFSLEKTGKKPQWEKVKKKLERIYSEEIDKKRITVVDIESNWNSLLSFSWWQYLGPKKKDLEEESFSSKDEKSESVVEKWMKKSFLAILNDSLSLDSLFLLETGLDVKEIKDLLSKPKYQELVRLVRKWGEKEISISFFEAFNFRERISFLYWLFLGEEKFWGDEEKTREVKNILEKLDEDLYRKASILGENKLFCFVSRFLTFSFKELQGFFPEAAFELLSRLLNSNEADFGLRRAANSFVKNSGEKEETFSEMKSALGKLELVMSEKKKRHES
ncbi:hypothetical protein J7J95_02165 [bacterium]|nr:hypothetical protein [bacterium]